MINIYFIRHGLAGDRADYADDSQRPLTSEGERKTRQVAKALKKLGLHFNLLQTSPFIRAHQTSQILAEVFGNGTVVSVNPLLAPEGELDRNFDQWCLELNQNFEEWQSQNFAVGLVGHEPDLSAWAEMLLWGDIRGVLVLKKAGIIGVTLPDSLPVVGKSYLFLLAPPKLLLLS
jgi:phosphohistidine phosphatase